MDAFEKSKKEILKPVFFEAGAGLYDCQAFENAVGYMLYLLSRLGVVGLDPRNAEAILDHKAKKTAGQLVEALRMHATLNDGIEQALATALEARNELIHRYFTKNVERLIDPDNHPQIIKEIRQLRSDVQNGRRILDPFVKAFAATVDGYDILQFSEDAKVEMLTRWQADG